MCLWLFFFQVIGMKLHLKRDVSADDIRFVAFNESGSEKYSVCSERTKLSAKLNLAVRTPQGEVAAKIRRFPVGGASAFVLRVGKQHITLVLLATKRGIYSFYYGNNWHILGNIADRNFTVIDVDKTVILNHRRHAGYCTLEYYRPENELYCLMTSVCVNLINTVEKPVLLKAGG